MGKSETLLERLGIDGLLDLVYPPICLGCDAVINERGNLLCQSCLDKISEFDNPYCSSCRQIILKGLKCRSCEDKGSIPVFSLGYYSDPLKELIHKLKYNGYKKVGVELTEKLVSIFSEQLSKLKADGLVPIPLSSYRQRNRGFNQAAIIAQTIGDKLNVPVVEDVLIKTAKTKDQARLSMDKRQKNIIGAFGLADDSLAGKRVILVDDVITTGATVGEAIKILKGGSVRVVGISSLAVTV